MTLKHNRRVLVLLLATMVAADICAASVQPRLETSRRPTGDTGAVAEPAARSAAPVDLNPRPLGKVREQPTATPAAGRAAEGSGSAAAALWSNSFVRTTASLAIVLGLILALAALAKRVATKNGSMASALGYSGSRPAGIIEVLGRYPIGRGQTLLLIKLDRRVLLLGQTAGRLRGASGSVSTLCEIDDAESVASILTKVAEHEGQSHAAKFSSLLQGFHRSHETGPDEQGFDASELRRVAQSAEGDRAELWDEQAVVHKFPVIQPGPEVQRIDAAPRAIEQVASTGTYAPAASSPVAAHPSHTPSTDSYSAIRQRLHALKGEAHR